jgi:hypothetical protein
MTLGRFTGKNITGSGNIMRPCFIRGIWIFRIGIVISLLGLFTVTFAQQDTIRMIKYTTEFRFKEGIFLNFDQVKQNNPIPKSRIITQVPYDDPDFFERVLDNKKIQVFDNIGVKQEINTSNLWGFSRNGVLYINLNDGFYRITIVGSICHFVATLTTYDNNYYPYYSYSYPYYRYPYNPYYSPYSSTPNTEMRQYLLDFKTGNVVNYDVAGVELLLMSDPVLHDEFATLNKKKRKQLKFLYIRKFNEKHPLYFPDN